MSSTAQKWIVGVTGASGIRYAVRLIEVLAACVDEVHVVFSEAAVRVLNDEEGIKASPSNLSAQLFHGRVPQNLVFHSIRDIGAVIASGSATMSGMVIVPCSMSTLGAVACGTPQNLIHRAADVTMKEGRKLILVPRETPLSAIHLENMLKLSRLGVCILPAMPGFYHRPAGIKDLVDMLVMKILDQMGIHRDLVQRWKSSGPEQEHPRE